MPITVMSKRDFSELQMECLDVCMMRLLQSRFDMANGNSAILGPSGSLPWLLGGTRGLAPYLLTAVKGQIISPDPLAQGGKGQCQAIWPNLYYT